MKTINLKCPCGSKKKHKNCCGRKNININKNFRKKVKKKVKEMHLKRQAETQYQVQNFGYAPPIKSCLVKGRRYVAVGGSIYISDDPDNDWETPIQFLISHLKTLLGDNWFDKQFELCACGKHV